MLSRNQFKSLTFFGFLTAILGGCGLEFGGDGSISLNEPVPSGTLVESGTFSAVSDVAVSGAVKIYLQDDGRNIVRLESFSIDDRTSRRVVATTSGEVLRASLKATGGNQNYSTSATGSVNFVSVEIIDTSRPTGQQLLATSNPQ